MSTDGGNRVRASDAEREEYAKMLRAAMTEGRLTLEEGEERLARVYAAKYRDELPQLTADLPNGGRTADPFHPRAKVDFERQARRIFAGHTGLVVAIGAILVGLWVLSGAHHFFWPAIPLLFLTFSLMRAARWRRWALYANRFGAPRGPWGPRGSWGHGPWTTNWSGQGPQDGGWGPRRGSDPWSANSDSTRDR